MAAGDIELPSRASRPTFLHPDSSQVASHDGEVDRLIDKVRSAAASELGREARISAGLRAGLEFLAANPALARLLLVDSLVPSSSARRDYQRVLRLCAQALRAPSPGSGAGAALAPQTACLLAGGLASHLSGRVLAGEASCLAGSYRLLLRYLLAPSVATARAVEQHGVRG